MASGRASVDLVIERRGTPIVAVEVRNVAAPSSEWAAESLRNLLEHGDVARCEYILLAFQNRLYLWRDPKLPVSLPEFEANTSEALAPYLARLRRPLDKLSQSGFELLIQAWLFEVVMGVLPDAGDRKWLVESGLADAVRDANVRPKIAA